MMILVRRRLASVFWVFVALIWARPRLEGQSASFEGQRIVNIQFEPKQQPLDPEEINQMLPLRRGQPLRREDVRAAIERLFATGRYADIQVAAEPYQDGVILRFLTRNSWFIGSVSVAGNLSSPPNPGQVENAAQLDLGQPYTGAKLDDAVTGQRRLLEANGLFRGTIHPVFDWDNEYQQIHIRFEVTGGPRARFTTPVLTGDIQMDPDRILRATRFRRWLTHGWKPMTQTRVRQALNGVRTLYEKDRRLEAKISLDSIKYNPEENRAVPTLRIDAGPRIQINTLGVKFSQSKLARYVPVFEEHSLDRDLLAEGARNLQDYLQSQGYFDSEVVFKEQRVISDQASIDYLINTGSRHKLVFIGIGGNKYFTTETIRERLFLRPASFLQFPHGRYSQDLLRRDEQSIVNLYQANGFREAKASHRLEDDYQGRKGALAVFLEIQEGPQSFVNSLAVDGIVHLDKAKILGLLSSGARQPFSEFNVAVDRDAILAQYFQNGFPNASFEWNFKAAATPDLIDLRYTIREGSQQFVRQLLFSPQALKHTRPSLVNRDLTLNPGDPLSPTAMTDIQRRLYDLGVFARVDMAVQDPDGDTQRKYVLYDLEEAGRYSIALGFGAEFARIGGCNYCLEEPTGQTGFSPLFSFAITRSNLWGVAHSISLRTRISTLDQEALLTYTWPRFEHSDKLSLSFNGLYQDSKDVRTFASKREETSAQLSERLSKSVTFLYRYTFRRVGVDQASLKITPELIPLLAQPVRLGLLGGNIIQDRRDDPVDSHKGIYNTLDIGLAATAFGSQRDFLRVLARNSTYHPLGRKLVLARSTEFGDVFAFHYSGDITDAVPLPERFFGGGDASDRGFPEYQSGPRDPETGFPIGGTALFFNQTELRFPLIGENVGGVLFHDFGNTFSSLDHLSFRVKQENLKDFDYMVHSVGFGIRYRTPIGPFRMDLAYSINPPQFFGFKGTEQDLVNAGVNPCATVANQCTQQSVSHFQFFFSIGQTF